jgi:Zinc-binding dehydrogenase
MVGGLHLSPPPDNLEGHPFHLANNINGVGITSIVDYQVLPLDSRVQALQEAYIRKVIDNLHDLPNVLWEVANESSGGGRVDKNVARMMGFPDVPEWGDSTEWQYWVIDVVKRYELEIGYEPLSIEMGCKASAWRNGSHQRRDGSFRKTPVQIAKLLGAGRVVGTGRNETSIKQVKEFGADAVVDLKQSDDKLAESFKQEAGDGYDVILDFLWGHPTEILIKTLIPTELRMPKPVRLIQIGEKAGTTISLSADSLRTSGLEIRGGAAGITPEAMGEGTNQVWEWLKANKLQMDIEQVPLKEIEHVWKRTDFQGKRIVIVP